MTHDNRRRNIDAEVRRGDESLESAEILYAAGKLADAVSRAYYAAFHYAQALHAVGRREDARVALRKALDGPGTFAERDAALKLAEELK